ncbi:hypothetical protein GCM10008018_23600 [Paenibacillus marchantiophytorum]|uniref:Uncharacterized protein n=1 Tax=Paenibacillus marchantiophytorum TaxID=1619310 RepID=A0ABQ1ELJ4_9BACL|nr:hypothetical protein GCM10008018_23600 [Paenibacillus marchantiophytorum]
MIFMGMRKKNGVQTSNSRRIQQRILTASFSFYAAIEQNARMIVTDPIAGASVFTGAAPYM